MAASRLTPGRARRTGSRSARHLPFHRQLRLEALAVTKDARHRKDPITGPIPRARVVLLQAAVDVDGIPALGMADVVDGDIVVLAPEKGHVGEGRALPDDGARHR